MRRWELEAVTFLDLMMVMWSVYIALVINFDFGCFIYLASVR